MNETYRHRQRQTTRYPTSHVMSARYFMWKIPIILALATIQRLLMQYLSDSKEIQRENKNGIKFSTRSTTDVCLPYLVLAEIRPHGRVVLLLGATRGDDACGTRRAMRGRSLRGRNRLEKEIPSLAVFRHNHTLQRCISRVSQEICISRATTTQGWGTDID